MSSVVSGGKYVHTLYIHVIPELFFFSKGGSPIKMNEVQSMLFIIAAVTMDRETVN